jgi:hypothetical protein
MELELSRLDERILVLRSFDFLLLRFVLLALTIFGGLSVLLNRGLNTVTDALKYIDGVIQWCS